MDTTAAPNSSGAIPTAGYQQGYILSKKAVEKHGDGNKWNLIGTGPFYFDRHLPRERIVLEAFDRFPRGRPAIDEVHWFDVPEDATKLIGLEKGTFDLVYSEAAPAARTASTST